ncbi:MAG: hypothetical protein Q9221_007615 [Calogaya cf. arnoldii]
MAGEAPDPKTFGSWEDAFHYPIAAVRGMERQLRNDIGSNREKLRSLVGASYRDLLGTAESIIQMDGQMQQVESYIGGMGMKCNSRVLEKKAANLRAWDNDSKAIAAKVLVTSRLLHKKISQRGNPPPYLELLRNRLASLRRKLLKNIDRHLKSLESSQSTLLEAMCAFSLATSSSSTDVLRHFHHIRQSAVSELGQREDDNERISKSLQLIVKTLRDCQIIVPTQLARALETLKTTPLLQSPDIQALRGLNLELNRTWLGEDINSFTPYVRHDDLQKTEANRHLEQWAETAFSSFLRDLRKMIEKVQDPAIIVHLRQELLKLWLSNKRHTMGTDNFDVLNWIRNAFNNRFQHLIHQHTANLGDVSSLIGTLLEDWNPAVSDVCPPLWDHAIVSLDVGSGGKVLKEELYKRAYSRSEPVRNASTMYTEWLDSINNLERLITQLQEKKWTDELDDMDEDDETLEDLHNMLSEDDPHLLHKTFEDDLKESFRMLRGAFEKYTKSLQPNHGEGTLSAQKSAFLLRVWKDIASPLPSIYRDLKHESLFVYLLQAQVSETVLQGPVAHCDKRISKCLQHKQLQARVLWEGDPQHPVLPSPWAFRLLQETVESMTVFGVDIWTPEATDILKQRMRDALAPIVKKLPELPRQVNGHDANEETTPDDEEGVSQNDKEGAEADSQDKNGDNGETKNGEEKESEEDTNIENQQEPNGDRPGNASGPSEEVMEDITTQRLFDAVYLDYALHVELSPEDRPHFPDLFDSAQRSILDDLDMEDFQQSYRTLERMRKDAEAYWKRTELLFALLA